MDKKEAFIKELSELSKKHKMFIGACGCCASPYVDDEEGNEVCTDLSYDDENEVYTSRVNGER